MYRAFVELDEREPTEERLDEVQGELLDWRASVTRSAGGFLATEILIVVDTVREAAATAVIVAQAAAQRPARAVEVVEVAAGMWPVGPWTGGGVLQR